MKKKKSKIKNCQITSIIIIPITWKIMTFIVFLWKNIVDEPNDSQQSDYSMYRKSLIKLLNAIGWKHSTGRPF